MCKTPDICKEMWLHTGYRFHDNNVDREVSLVVN